MAGLECLKNKDMNIGQIILTKPKKLKNKKVS
jgi:hypothetical protein